MAASFAISASWHLLVLAVLALAVHPFQLPPRQNPPIELQLLPPLAPTPPPVELKLRPRIEETEPIPPAPPPRPEPKPQPPVPQPQIQVQAPPAPAASQPLQAARKSASALSKRIELEPIPAPTPPEPVTITRPAPVIQPKAVELDRPAPTSKSAVVANLPSLDISKPAAAEPAPPTPVQVLTNDQTVKAPAEIKPPEHKAGAGQPPPLPASPPVGGGAASGAPPAGGGARSLGGPVVGGFDASALRGMRLRLGCASPDTYHLTPEDRADCLVRFGAEAKNARELGPNIPADKQARFDHSATCREASNHQSVPSSTEATAGSSIMGLGNLPSLRQCGPGDR